MDLIMVETPLRQCLPQSNAFKSMTVSVQVQWDKYGESHHGWLNNFLIDCPLLVLRWKVRAGNSQALRRLLRAPQGLQVPEFQLVLWDPQPSESRSCRHVIPPQPRAPESLVVRGDQRGRGRPSTQGIRSLLFPTETIGHSKSYTSLLFPKNTLLVWRRESIMLASGTTFKNKTGCVVHNNMGRVISTSCYTY